MSGKTTKVPYAQPAALVEEVRHLVREGAAPSYGAFVDRALMEKVDDEWRKQLAEAFQDAARDPMFLADTEAVEDDFAEADAETLGMIPE